MSGEHKMGHVQPMKNYFLTFGALVILTVITVWVSRVTPSLVIAMSVATCKALLVALFFMHGKYEGKDTWAFIIYPFILLAILLTAVYTDYYTGSSRTNKDNYLVKPTTLVGSVHHGDDHGDSHGAAADHGAKKDDHAAEGDGHAAEGDGHADDHSQNDSGHDNGGH